jgi:hypothetical protein
MASPTTPTSVLPPGPIIDNDTTTTMDVAVGLSNPKSSHARKMFDMTHRLQNTGCVTDARWGCSICLMIVAMSLHLVFPTTSIYLKSPLSDNKALGNRHLLRPCQEFLSLGTGGHALGLFKLPPPLFHLS